MLILAEVDGSKAALGSARAFAKMMDATIGVVQAWEYPATAALPGGPTLQPQVDTTNAVTHELDQFLGDELGQPPEEIEAVVEPGTPSLTILRVAAQTGADLIVVGKRGLGVIAGRLLGSVSRRIVEHSNCPAAVVPGMRGRGIGHVIVSVDESANARAALELVATVTAAQRRPIVVVHAVSPAPLASPLSLGEAMDRAGQAIADEQCRPAVEVGPDVCTVVRTIAPCTLITATALELARLVVVESRGAGPMASLLMGGTATCLAERSEHPLVLVLSHDRDAMSPSTED